MRILRGLIAMALSFSLVIQSVEGATFAPVHPKPAQSVVFQEEALIGRILTPHLSMASALTASILVLTARANGAMSSAQATSSPDTTVAWIFFETLIGGYFLLILPALKSYLLYDVIKPNLIPWLDQRLAAASRTVANSNFLLAVYVLMTSANGLVFGLGAWLTGLHSAPSVGITGVLQDLTGVDPAAPNTFYINQKRPWPSPDMMPEASVAIPVYKESWWVLEKTIKRAIETVDQYNAYAGRPLAHVVVLDDGLAVTSDVERKRRLPAYSRLGVSVVARPKNESGVYSRRGFFPKAGNQNNAQTLSQRVTALVAQGLAPQQAAAQVQATGNADGYRFDLEHIQGDPRLGAITMWLDNDSVTPVTGLIDSVPFFLDDPTLGYLQHVSEPANGDENLLTRIHAVSSRYFWGFFLKARAVYSPVPLLGHNVVVRNEALPAEDPWHEGRGADDLVTGMSIRERGYTGKLADLYATGEGFQEGLPTRFLDLAGQFRRYGAAGPGTIFMPIKEWGTAGILRPEYRALLHSARITKAEKFDLALWGLNAIPGVAVIVLLMPLLLIRLLRGVTTSVWGPVIGTLATKGSQSGFLFYHAYRMSSRRRGGSFSATRWILNKAKFMVLAGPLFTSILFQFTIGTLMDLLLSRSRSYRATAIADGHESQWQERLLEAYEKVPSLLVTGFLLIVVDVGYLIPKWWADYSASGLALVGYVTYVGLSFLLSPFIYDRNYQMPRGLQWVADTLWPNRESINRGLDEQRFSWTLVDYWFGERGVQWLARAYRLATTSAAVLTLFFSSFFYVESKAFERVNTLRQINAQFMTLGKYDLSYVHPMPGVTSIETALSALQKAKSKDEAHTAAFLLSEKLHAERRLDIRHSGEALPLAEVERLARFIRTPGLVRGPWYAIREMVVRDKLTSLDDLVWGVGFENQPRAYQQLVLSLLLDLRSYHEDAAARDPLFTALFPFTEAQLMEEQIRERAFDYLEKLTGRFPSVKALAAELERRRNSPSAERVEPALHKVYERIVGLHFIEFEQRNEYFSEVERAPQHPVPLRWVSEVEVIRRWLRPQRDKIEQASKEFGIPREILAAVLVDSLYEHYPEWALESFRDHVGDQWILQLHGRAAQMAAAMKEVDEERQRNAPYPWRSFYGSVPSNDQLARTGQAWRLIFLSNGPHERITDMARYLVLISGVFDEKSATLEMDPGEEKLWEFDKALQSKDPFLRHAAEEKIPHSPPASSKPTAQAA